MSNHARRRNQPDLFTVDPPPGFWKRARVFVIWFFAPRPFPRAWQRRPYLRNRGRRPGRSTR